MTYDVVVLGEVLVELCSTEHWRRGTSLTLDVSGDALNSAAAAAAAGARVALLTRVAGDELGDVIVERIGELGIDVALVHRTRGQNGMYLVRTDPSGDDEFVYARRGSAGSQLSADDVRAAEVGSATVVLASGVTCALSPSAAEAVLEAARSGSRFVYDPNFRARLTTADAAAAQLRALAGYAELVTPSCPAESGALLGLTDPDAVATAVRDLGARSVAVTCGPGGVVLDDGTHLPAVPAPRVLDQTGAGDVFAGTVAARFALGDDLVTAARLGTAASSLALGGAGGSGLIPPLAHTRAHLDTTRERT